MNKTVNINLASTFFHIDEKAYAKLKTYLKSLENGFKNTVGKEEILKDIEARIAELFQEIKTNPDYVISEEDVDKTIEVLGQPEDFLTDQEEEEQTEETTRKKLFRDPDDKYIAGIASGLGHYFGIDNTWIRLILLFLFIFSVGTLVTVYLLLWILVPEAKTTADKLKMKGKPVNISTIEKKIKEEFEEVSSKIKDIDYEKTTNSLKKKSRNFFQFLEGAIKAVPSIIFKILGFFFLILAVCSIISILIAAIVLLFFGTVFWPFELLGLSLIPNLLWVLSIFLFVLIPFLFLFSLAIRLLRGQSKTYGTTTRFVLFGIWIAAIISCITLTGNEISKHRVTATKTEKHSLTIQPTDTLYVNLFSDDLQDPEWVFKKNYTLNKLIEEIGEDRQRLAISIKKSNDLNSLLEIRASAKGGNQNRAQDNVKDIVYNWELNEQTLYLDRFTNTIKLSDLNSKHIALTLRLSEGQAIHLSNNLREYMSYPVKNDQGFKSSKTTGYFWKMGSNELECLNCPTSQSKLRVQYQNEEGDEKLHLKVDEDGIHLKTK